MSDEKLREYYSVFTDAWRVFKRHADAKNNPETWETLIADMHEVCSNHGKSEFVKSILLAVVEELGRV